ncbi:hypothetical protein TPELB_17940 [Terrisporobacter petrolearius]|uniref:DAC domain-containing protein n=1 Tax=Terrisporobacter petrolearius TaxID=1460447 RepID=A0ABZ3FFI1_9FIRM
MIDEMQLEKLSKIIESKLGGVLEKSLKNIDNELCATLYIGQKNDDDRDIEEEEKYFPRRYKRNGVINVSTAKPYESTVYSDLGEFIIRASTNNLLVQYKGITEYVEDIIYYVIEECKNYLSVDLEALFKSIEKEESIKEVIEHMLKGDFSDYIEFCTEINTYEKYEDEINKRYINYLNSLITKGNRNSNIIKHLDIISATSYEGSNCKGKLAIFKDYDDLRKHIDISKSTTIEFMDKIDIRDYKSIRKTIEMSGDDWAIICDCNDIYGLTKVNENLRKSSAIVKFIDYYEYEISVINKDRYYGTEESEKKIHLKDGKSIKFKENNDLNKNKDIMENISNEFGTLDEKDKQNLNSIIDAIKKQEKGSMLVITNRAEKEAKHLKYQSTLIEPQKLTVDLVNKISCIDGSILIDEKGICHAIGVILDGPACRYGNKGRGARYNSAIKYIYNRINNTENDYKCLAIVKSEDGMIDIIDRKMFNEVVEHNENNESIHEINLSNIEAKNVNENNGDTEDVLEMFSKCNADRLNLEYIGKNAELEFKEIYKELNLFNKAIDYYNNAIDKKKDAPLFLYMNRARCYYFLAIKEHGSEQSTKFNEFIVKSEQDFDEALKINNEDKRFGNIRNIKDEIVRMKNNIDLLKKYNSEDLKKDYYIYFDKFVHLDEICKLIDKDSNNENLYLFRVDICYEIIKNCKFIIITSVEAKFMLNDILKSYNLNPKNIKIYNIIEKIYFRFLNDTDHFLKEKKGYLIKNDYDFIVDHRQKLIKDIIEYISIENELSDLENIYYVLGKIYFKLSKFDIKNSKKYLNKSLKYIDKNVKDSIKNKLYIGLHYKYEVLIDICKEIKSLEKDKRSLDDLTKKISIYNKKLKKINTQNSN